MQEGNPRATSDSCDDRQDVSGKLREVEAEIDETVLAAFITLTEDESRYMVQRTKEFPLNQVLVRDEPGAPTKQLPVKYWKTGERYRV